MTAAEAMKLCIAAAMETNHDLAVRMLRDAIVADPDAVLPRFQMATILGSRGLHSQAAEVLRLAVQGAGKQDGGVRFLYARQLHLAGDLEAINQYEAALILDPACEKAHLYLAQLLAPGPETDLETAMMHAQRALELRPNTSMVPESEFIQTYEMAHGGEHVSPMDSTAGDELESTTLEELVLLHPRVITVLEEHGISCVDCAGYSHMKLADAAAEVNADLTRLINRIRTMILSEVTL